MLYRARAGTVPVEMKDGTSGASLCIWKPSHQGFLPGTAFRLLDETPFLLPLFSTLSFISDQRAGGRHSTGNGGPGHPVSASEATASLQTPPFYSRAPCVRLSDCAVAPGEVVPREVALREETGGSLGAGPMQVSSSTMSPQNLYESELDPDFHPSTNQLLGLLNSIGSDKVS